VIVDIEKTGLSPAYDEIIEIAGREHIDEDTIHKLKNKLPTDEKKKILDESGGDSEWIYSVLRKVCLE
jgi:DNA polymerase III alpha subunit (gram-positive type)